MPTKVSPAVAARKKLSAEIAATQRRADQAKKSTKQAKTAFKLAKQRFKDAKRMAKKYRKELKALKAELAALAKKPAKKAPAAKKISSRISPSAPAAAPVIVADGAVAAPISSTVETATPAQ